MTSYHLKKAQKEWAYHKYWVMGHSQYHYNQIRLLFKGNDWSTEKEKSFLTYLDEAKKIAPTKETLTTAYQHMWGYFKKEATVTEKTSYKTYIENAFYYQKELEQLIKTLAEKYDKHYISKSKFFDEGF
ncbi:YbgA family protein [Streptococcus sp. CSL10205-OR2]|uniref:YbgA family protein n=1 Tax=Streptococcus sp. CSL10205-OR2 TaxID=2980558 RepID=UPI0021D83F23|nr:YbgA family protein [Streptococcus sp. CSL10205-OR2]MCU9533902.1 YbgA family protein [Streptococcus sp. CSL10205-OR2]